MTDDSPPVNTQPRQTDQASRGQRGAFRRRWLSFAALALGVTLLPGGNAHGYRFFRPTSDHSPIPLAADAVHWSSQVWSPFQTLEWVVSDSPGWTEPWVDFDEETQDPPFASRAEAIPFIETALGVWSDIPTARISWRLAGLGPGLYRDRDHVNAVRVHSLDGGGSYAALFDVHGDLVECDVNLSPAAAANLEDRGMHTLIHEFGHCLGLAHSGMFPAWDSSWRRRSFETAVWWQDPKMSYGGDRDEDLTDDDILGASLLRPAPDFLETTGSIGGRVTQDGEPARFARVVATRISGGDLGFTVNAFANREGEFLLEGLRPGDYLVAAGTMVRGSAHTSLLDAGAATGADDQYLLNPIRVTAGIVTHAPPVSLRSGREVSVLSEPQ